MNILLYATDCSSHSVAALRYAYELSKDLGKQLLVLHCYSTPPVRVSTIRPKSQLDKRAYEEQLAHLMEYCKKNLPDGEADANWIADVVVNEPVAQGILLKAGEVGADLIGIGMKDEHSLRGFFAGNIAYTLLDKSHCPVMLIPNGIKPEKRDQLVYATDFEMADVIAIKKLIPYASTGKSIIHVIHIPSGDEYPAEDQMAWFGELLTQETGYDNIEYHVLNAGKIRDGIINFVKDTDADLLAMLERTNNSLLKGYFHKDLVKVVGRQLDIPILAFVTK